MESVDFLSNHSPYHCGAVGFGGRAPTTISMTDVLFDSNIADSVGGAVEMDIDGAVSFDIVDSTFIANEAPTIASAMNLVPSDDGYCDLVVTNSSFDGNISSSAAIWAYSDTWVTLDSSAMTNNVGGAVRLDDDGSSTLYSIDSDWGVEGVDDNTPCDVEVQNGATFTGYDSSETFTCTGALGCF